jgi:uncharacterized protein YdhG (YjbR/CyaY superfamily)
MAPKTKPKAKPGPATVDEYLAGVRPEHRVALEKLRKAIHAAAPGVEECISYQMPGFRFDGKMLVWMGDGANHCALYPGAMVAAYKDELEGYVTSKGTIRFQPEKPLPAAFIRKLVKAKIAMNAAEKPKKR